VRIGHRSIKGLSPRSAITSALFKSNKGKIKTLIDEFSYPRFGAGQTYEKMAAYVRQRSGNVWTKALVRRIRRDAFTARAVILDDGIVQVMDPPAPDSILESARLLPYRNHIGVNLLIDGNRTFGLAERRPISADVGCRYEGKTLA
jgi:hypothetical protein